MINILIVEDTRDKLEKVIKLINDEVDIPTENYTYLQAAQKKQSVF